MTRAYLYTTIAVVTWGASLLVNKAIVAAWCIALGWTLMREGFGPGLREGSALIVAGNSPHPSSRRKAET